MASGEEQKMNPKGEAFSFHSGDAMGLTAGGRFSMQLSCFINERHYVALQEIAKTSFSIKRICLHVATIGFYSVLTQQGVDWEHFRILFRH